MKCKSCGVEFLDGIFCPECGTKNEMVGMENNEAREVDIQKRESEKAVQLLILREKAEQERLAKEKAEYEERLVNAKVELERFAKEKVEQERIVKEKAEYEERLANAKVEQERLAKEKSELEARTFNGITYGSEEETHIAIEENGKIDLLKQKMLRTKSQKKRKEILAEFNSDIRTSVAKQRFNLLQERVGRDKPKSITINQILGITIIVAIILTVVISSTGNVENIFFYFVVCWYGMGLPVWIIWKIVLFIKSKTKSFYLHIKDI